jgi:hypothetical protein
VAGAVDDLDWLPHYVGGVGLLGYQQDEGGHGGSTTGRPALDSNK